MAPAMCAMLQPAITSIQVPKQQFGTLAVDRMIQRINHPDDHFVKTEVGTSLIIRESVTDLNK